MRYAIAFLLLISNAVHAATALDRFSFGRFGESKVYRPADVRHVAIVFSDDQGWTEKDDALARTLSERGFLVAGIDLRHYAAELGKPRDKCSYLAGEFEDFSHELQKRFSPQRYHLPVIVGVGRSAELVYGVSAQGSSGTFVGFATSDFKPQWRPLIRLCQSYALRYDTDKNGVVTLKPAEQLSTPWIAVEQQRDASANVAALRAFVETVGTAKASIAGNEAQSREQLVAAIEELARPDQDPKVLADELRDLPLEEVRATGTATTRMAVFLTGDGGWAEIDQGIAAELAKRGVDVVALSSLQYFWKPRSPDETAKDVARIVRHYLAAWRKRDVFVIGYSFGADVAAFVVNRLPADLRANIASVNLLGLASTADFEVHVTTWLGVDHHGLPTQPEVERLSMPVLCVYGEGEKDTVCTVLKNPRAKSVKIGDGHHFGDRYSALAEAIFASAPMRP